MAHRENTIDRMIIFANAALAGTAKAMEWHDILTNAAITVSLILACLRIVDWCVRRYKFGWKPPVKGDDTEIIKKE